MEGSANARWRAGLRRMVRPAGALLLAACVALISGTRFWQSLEDRVFDTLTTLTLPGEQTTPIFLVAIDDASIAELGLPWPWPRSVHARLIETLNRVGAGVIAFDVIFEQASDPAEDASFARAIQAAGNVVLAAGEHIQETPYGTYLRRQEPLPALAAAAAGVGMTRIELGGDLIARKVPEAPDALWRTTLRVLERRVPEAAPELLPPRGSLLRYLGPPQTFTYLPYARALELTPENAGDGLAQAIVLVGRAASVTTDLGQAQTDTFAVPTTWHTGQLMPGPEIHATAMENALRHQVITPSHPAARVGVIALVTWLALATIGRAILRVAVLQALGGLMLVALGVGVLWHSQAIFHPPLALAALIVGTLTGRVITVARRERADRLALKRSFALYLSPAVVEEVAAQPDKLQLGGEQKEITVLFTDLANFTTLSEHLPPRHVAQLLNDYFERMTQTVFRHGGTLDKFIGDAVMAFWNSPLPQADHAERAVRCALAMQAELATFNERLRADGRAPLAMRIGVHTGEAIVGNLGCPSRFSYTALGDTVNLASRLESANKEFGTGILLSEATARQLPAALPVREVAETRVKGRLEAVRLFTPETETPPA